MKNLVLLAALALCLSSAARADVSPSHAAALEKMFTVIKLDEQYEASLIAGFESGIGLSEDQIKSLPQAQQDKFKAAMVRVQARLMGTMGWSAIKSEMVAIYAKVFSEKEAQDITTLMDSPAGQLLVTKQTAVIKDVTQFTQDKMKTLAPEITKIVQEEMSK